MPPSSGPSWRGSSNKPAAGGARSWRRPGSGSTSWNPRSKWLQTVLSVLSTLAATAAIWLFIFLVFIPSCNRTNFAVVAPAPYTDPGMPPQPFAKQDVDEFRDRFGAQTFLPAIEPKKTDSKSTPVKWQTNSKLATNVIFVTALAGETAEGVILYRTESAPDDVDSGPNSSNGYIPLDRLWKSLSDLPSAQKKIIVLDLAGGPIDWRWGQFFRPQLGSVSDKGGVIGAVSDVLSTIPNLAILTSGAPGEASWASPILKQSVFAHFLIRAIAGEADGSAGRAQDRQVTLDELYDFVLTRTNHWVAQNRDPRGQHPQLLISPESRERMTNAVVAEVRGKIAAPTIDPTKTIDGTQLKKLEKLWEQRDRWSKNESEQWHPVAWRQLVESIRRAEQWWLSGQSEEMSPHLFAGDRAAQVLDQRYANRDRFIVAGIARRELSGAFSNRDLAVPELQLSQAFDQFAPVNIVKPNIEQSVALRKLAEQQSWHSFRSRLWTGALLTEADRDRRYAEDLLFIGGQTEIQASNGMRQTASAKLEQHQQISSDLSALIRLHNRLLAELPDLAWWAAQRFPDEMISKPPQESKRFQIMTKYAELIDDERFRPPAFSQQERELSREANDPNDLQATEVQLLLLFEQTRQLGRLIDREQQSSSQAFAAAREWRSESDEVKRFLTDPDRGLDAINKRLTRLADGLIGSSDDEANTAAGGSEQGQTQHYHWQRLRNALQWTGLPAKTRRGLFIALEESDRTLIANSQKVPVDKSAVWNGDDWAAVDGCWQALWALQTLSIGVTDSSMEQRWVNWKTACLDSKKREHQLTELGTSVRKEFRDRERLANRIPNDSDQLEDVLRSLLVAERAARSMHGYDASLFNVDHDPIQQRQEFDLGALCISQAERYLDDFWGNKVAGEPWYVQAVNQCLRVGGRQQELLGGRALKSAREKISLRLEERKTANMKIASVDGKIDLTLVNQRPTTVTVAIDERVPPGTAAVWLEEDVDATAKILEFMPVGRRGVTATSLTSQFTIRKQKSPSDGNCEEIHVQPRLLFRARNWNEKESGISVNPCRPNSINREYQFPATTGEIVVRGADRRDTIFILDCSLSMNDPIKAQNPTDNPPRRFDAARDGLSQILRDFAAPVNVRNPYIVGLMALGHRAKEKNGKVVINPNWPPPIPPSVAADWREDFEMLVKPDQLMGIQFDQMIAYLDPNKPFQKTPLLQPFGETPLLGAVLSASNYLIGNERGGVVVAICDGAYNEEAANGPRFRNLLALFQRNSDVSLHLVAFDINNQADITVLTKLAAKTGGKFHQAPNLEELEKSIKDAMKPRHFIVLREAAPQLNLESNLGQPIDKLSPDTYRVQFPGLQDFVATIYGGERLVFDLESGKKQLKHYRPVPKLSRRIQATRATSFNEPTRFGYLKAARDKETKRVLLLFCLDRDDAEGMIDRPKEIRIDVSPSDSHRRLSGSWKLAPEQSVPAWQIELSDWPDDEKPEVQAYWKMTRTEPDVELPIEPLTKAPQTVTLVEWPERSLIVTAEQQAGKVIVQLQAGENAVNLSVFDVRVELGKILQIESRFQPIGYNCTSEFFEAERQIRYKFDVGDKFELTNAHVALTSFASLKRDVSQLQTPLLIPKWDDEQ